MPQSPSVILSFRIAEGDELLTSLKTLAVQDDESLSSILRKATVEYVKRHSPGNDQLILGHWQSNIPLPMTLQEQCQHSFGYVKVLALNGTDLGMKARRCLNCGAKE